jgi:hypothetical protein
MARIALYLSEVEMAEVKRLAGDVPLSKWCKKKMFERMTFPISNGGEPRRAGSNPDSVEIPTPPTKKRESTARKALTGLPGDCKCGHARRFHFNGGPCSQCGSVGCGGYAEA